MLVCARMSTGMWVDGSQQVGVALGRVMARLGLPSSLSCVGRTLRRPSSERERLFGVCPAPVVSFGSYMAGSTAVNLAQSSALSLTISGVAFMSETRTPTSAAEISSVCSSTSWTSSTAVTCSPGTYAGGLIRLAVTVTGLVGTGAAFTFDSPAVSFASLARNIALSMDASVTVTGLSFGASQLTVTSSLQEGQLCSSTSWTSATSAGCRAAATSYTAGSIRAAVTVGTVLGSRVSLFTFDSPVVSFSNLYNGFNNGAQSIGSLSLTVSGLGFGGALERTATVWLVSLTRMCNTVSWTTATAVTCDQPDYMESTWINCLSTTVSGLVGTRTLLFTFDGARAFVSLRESIACRP